MIKIKNLKKAFFLIIIICSLAKVSNADLASDIQSALNTAINAIAACVTDPCNCGQPATYSETWNNTTFSRPLNANCPPYNKTAGRGGCIKQFPLADAFSQFFNQSCAESSPSSTYFSPKIHVRNQACNAFGCWSKDTDLDWDGECINWAGPLGYPLTRICARIAVPSNSMFTPPQPDDGYVQGISLNSEGAPVTDPSITLADGSLLQLTLPKLCAYIDPSVLSDLGSVDLFDINPLVQNIHINQGLHPIAKLLIFMVQQNPGTAIIDLINSLLSSSGASSVPGLNILSSIFNTISDIAKALSNTFVQLLTKYGQFNRVVTQHLGCVLLPQGPMPPPYCPTLPKYAPVPTVQSICQMNNDGTNALSILGAECVNSSLRNNFIYNSVRTSFDALYPLCPTSSSTNCARLSLGTVPTATILHNSTSGLRDIISQCSSSSSGVCFNIIGADPQTISNFSCHVSANGCQNGFRIVYAIVQGSTITPINYFRADLPDCTGNTNVPACQKVWGLNVGEFVDQALVFPAVQSQSNLSTNLSSSFTLTDPTGTSQSFKAVIPRQFPNSLNQPTTQICVYNNATNKSMGCANRQLNNLPSVYDCSANISGISCSTNYYVPQFITQLSVGSYSTAAVIEPLNISDRTFPAIINLAGATFNSYVTDNTFQTQPFTGPNSINNTTIYGSYTNGPPYTVNSSANPPTVTRNQSTYFISGIEYINGTYIEGGQYACIQPITSTHCPADTTMCVLSKLLNSNIVDCNSFLNQVMTKYANLALCPSGTNYNNLTAQVPVINGLTSGNNLTIYGTNCSGSGSNQICQKYCYTNSSRNLTTPVCQVSNAVADRIYPLASLGQNLQQSQYLDLNNPPFAGNNIVNCQTFAQKVSNYPNLSLCSSHSGCNIIDSMAALNTSNPNINIYSCPISNSYTYCYTSPNYLNLCDNNTSVSGVNCTNLNIQKTNYSNLIPCAQSTSLTNCTIAKHIPGSGVNPIAVDIYQCPALSYCYDGGVALCQSYNPSLSALRDKTPVELNRCISIPPAVCSAITAPGTSDNNATWSQANIGNYSTGTCLAGYSAVYQADGSAAPQSALQRRCLGNLTGQNALLQAITNVNCVNQCGGVSTPGAGDNNTLWSSVSVGQNSIGTCPSNYSPIDPTQNLTRACVAGSGGQPPTLAALPNNIGCYHNCPALNIRAYLFSDSSNGFTVTTLDGTVINASYNYSGKDYSSNDFTIVDYTIPEGIGFKINSNLMYQLYFSYVYGPQYNSMTLKLANGNYSFFFDHDAYPASGTSDGIYTLIPFGGNLNNDNDYSSDGYYNILYFDYPQAPGNLIMRYNCSY